MTSIALLILIVIFGEVEVTVGDEYDSKTWEEYLNGEAAYEDYDKDKARTAQDDTIKVMNLMTEQYNVPKGFSTEFTSEAPFVALLYNKGLVDIDEKRNISVWKRDFFKPGSICGGAVLTRNVVLTLCACVETLVFVNEKFRGKHKDVHFVNPKHDLLEDPYIVPFAERLYYTHGDRGYEPTPYQYKLNKLGEKGANQYTNQQCIDNYDEHGAQQDNEDTLSTTHAIMEFSPSFSLNVPEWYVPWPPHTYKPPYKKEEVVYFRPRTTVSIYSYAFGSLSDRVYKTPGGEAVNIPHSLMKLQLTRCDFLSVNYCELPDDYHPKYHTALGCFCDNGADKDTLCGGLIGSPVMYKGLLYGLLAERVPCRAESPRSAYVKGFDNQVIRRISNAIPDLYYKVHDIDEENAFRINSSQLVEYTLFFPPANVDQGLNPNLEVSDDEIEKLGDTDKYKENPAELKKIGQSGSPTIFTPSIFVEAVYISILSLISYFP
ncbi:hypothetical protein GE061_004481 [Apolygus lucorum]|uniref:Uncharacterized protein n=1 Tax=Apolygus lucorum TaxID=248454 RepID=A0A6A4IQ56_APOLU|nr:hypothetical protein GE061_004481 [Apolygus lucorum]